MATLYANPYDISATGFYFSTLEEYEAKYAEHAPVEEYEIEVIEVDSEGDAALFSACGINQANLAVWFDRIADMEKYEKAELFHLTSHSGFSLDEALDKAGQHGFLFHGTLLEYAEDHLFESGCCEIPEWLTPYVDAEKFARDLSYDGCHTEFEFAAETWVYCT